MMGVCKRKEEKGVSIERRDGGDVLEIREFGESEEGVVGHDGGVLGVHGEVDLRKSGAGDTDRSLDDGLFGPKTETFLVGEVADGTITLNNEAEVVDERVVGVERVDRGVEEESRTTTVLSAFLSVEDTRDMRTSRTDLFSILRITSLNETGVREFLSKDDALLLGGGALVAEEVGLLPSLVHQLVLV